MESDPRPHRILVKGQFRPGTIALRAGRRQRLLFRREETASCSERVVFPTLGRCIELPALQDVIVDLPPLAVGEYPFTCQRGALYGRLIVRQARSGAAPAPAARAPAHRSATAAFTQPAGLLHRFFTPGGQSRW